MDASFIEDFAAHVRAVRVNDLTTRLREAWADYRSVENDTSRDYYMEGGEEVPSAKEEARLALRCVIEEIRDLEQPPASPSSTRNLGRHGRSKRKQIAWRDGMIQTDAWGRPVGVRMGGYLVTVSVAGPVV